MPSGHLSSLCLLLERAAGGTGGVPRRGANPPLRFKQAVRAGDDDAIISGMPKTTSRWRERDLPSKVRKLGLPVPGSRRGPGRARCQTSPPRSQVR
jgi:hypothetical protein